MNPEDANPDSTPTSRPALDDLWLNRLQQEGLSAFLSEYPTPSPAFTISVEQLNGGLFFEAHESLENLWSEAPYPLKLFYYALIKLAVGLLQMERRNAKPAINQLIPAIQYLAPFTPAFLGLRTDLLVQQAKARLALLRSKEGDGLWDMAGLLSSMPFQTAPTSED